MSSLTATIDNLTLKQKAQLVTGQAFWYTAAIPTMGINSLMMTDGPSGLRKQASRADALGLNKSVQAVSFPTAALTASSFDKTMMRQLGVNLGQAAQAENVSILLGPGINIKRSPLDGRNFEYFSEDPYLAGTLGTAYVQGVQSQGVGVSVKHFAANNREYCRFTSSSDMDERTLREIYLAAFERIVKQAHPATLMCSYNAINGTLNSQNKRLLTGILRDEWGFDGLVMSDWGAVADRVAALKAGLDLEMPGKDDYSVAEIITGVQEGSLDEGQLDNAVRRVLQMVQNWGATSQKTKSYDKQQQHQFARQLAAESMVLLKNDQETLPLKHEKIAVVGALAKQPRYQGGGSSHVNAYHVTIPYDELQKRTATSYAPGYSLTSGDGASDQALRKEAVAACTDADKVVIFAGFPEQDESEGFDKTTISLPDNQRQLIETLSSMGKPVIVVLQNGSAVEMPWADGVDAILETYLAGEAVGEATADVLYGDVNPSGKLAETFPLQLADNPTFGTFNASPAVENYHEGIFVGYRYYDLKHMKVRYPFGYGLSYTKFDYDQLKVTINGTRTTVSVTVTNTGHVAGKDAVQLYVANRASAIEKEVRSLKGIEKVALQPGESTRVTFELNRRDFSWYSEQQGRWLMDSGQYEIQIGHSSREIALQQSIQLENATTTVKKLTMNTYIHELLGRSDLTDLLTEFGLKEPLDQMSANPSDAALLVNMPLRAANMIGLDLGHVQQFIAAANSRLAN